MTHSEGVIVLAVILIVPWLVAVSAKGYGDLQYGGSFVAGRPGNRLFCHPNRDTFG